MSLEDLHGLTDGVPLVREVILHGRPEAGVGKVVHAVGDLGVEAPAPLVVALGASLEAADPVVQAMLDRRVVAALEVQAGHVLKRAPVAADPPRA